MISLSLAAAGKALATVVASTLTGVAIRQTRTIAKNQNIRLRQRFRQAMQSGGLFIPHKAHPGAKTVWKLPRILALTNREYGFDVKVRMPVGMAHRDCAKALPVLQHALNAEVDLEMEGQDALFRCYSLRLPNHVEFRDIPDTDDIVIAHSRRGWETQQFHDPTLPHMLIGGATRMGKSNLMNVILLQLLRRHVELYLVDTKMTEFTPWKGVEKVKEVATEPGEAVAMVSQLVAVMERRAEMFVRAGVKKIADFNAIADQPLPSVYVVVDEFADFAKNKSFWGAVEAIARKGAFAGVYLIMATQRPSADCLPPAAKANMGYRVALRVTTIGNSQILLENDHAYTLPKKQGRCIVETNEGEWEAQIPFLPEGELQTALRQHKMKGEIKDDGYERGDGDSGSRCGVEADRGDVEPDGSTYVSFPG